MAKLNADQLAKTPLAQLKPTYLITGDEQLLVQECCDSLRHIARQADFIERELFHTDANFQWPNLLQSANSMSLFSDKKLLEVRLTNGKPGDAGSKAIQEYCLSPSPDNLLLIVAPKLERSAQNTKWYKAIDAIGGIVTLWPINESQLPRWIDQRLQRAGIRADSQAIDILAGRVEGNLLAATQEIEKLKLIAHDGIINSQMMASAVVDSARYNIFGLMDKALSGHPQAAAKTLNGLKGEGSEATVILWAITKDIRALIALKEAQQTGQRLELIARKNGIFDQRLPMIRGALQRLSPNMLKTLLRECAYTDRAIKGMAPGDPWNSLLNILLSLAGVRCLKPKTLGLLIK